MEAAPTVDLKPLWKSGIFVFAFKNGAELILFFQNIAGHGGILLHSDYTTLEEGNSYSVASLGM